MPTNTCLTQDDYAADEAMEAICRSFCRAQGKNPDDTAVVILGSVCDRMPLWQSHVPAVRAAMAGPKPVYTLFRTDQFSEVGAVRLEKWPEGIVLRVNGGIRWKSWQDPTLADVRED